MSDKGKDMGVFNIVDNRTGKKYTAGSTNMDQLKNQYKNKIEHANHHNEELRKDIEKGHTFRFEEVSRDCKTEDEIRALRDAEIYRNRNNTYNKDVNIYFDGGNPNAEYPNVKSEVKFNNIEDIPTQYNDIKPKEVKSKRTIQNSKVLNDYAEKFKSNISNEFKEELIREINSGKITEKTQISRRIRENQQKNKSNKQTKVKKVPKSHRDNPRYYGKNKIPEKPKRNLGSRRRVWRNKPKQKPGPKAEILHQIIELKNYAKRFDPFISNSLKNQLISDIESRQIVNKTQIKGRIKQEKIKEREEMEVTEDMNQILNNLQEIDEKISSIGFYNPEIKKHLEYEKKIELIKLQLVDYNKYLEIETSILKEELYRYVDEFPISDELKKELKLKINEGKINDKPQIAGIAIKNRKGEKLKKEIEEIDIEISELKRQIQDLEDKLEKLENDKNQLKKEYLIMDEETYKLEYKKIFELEKSILGEKSRLNRRLKQLERKIKPLNEQYNNELRFYSSS